MNTNVLVTGVKTEKLRDSASFPHLNLSHDEIVHVLSLIKPECVFIREAYLKESELLCTFNTFAYPYSKAPVRHFTREHAITFLTQGCYLIIAIFGECDPRWPLDRATAISLAVREQMVFTDIELRFRSLMKNEDGIQLRLFNPDFRIMGRQIFAEVEFEFPPGCSGQCKGVITLD